MSWLGDIFGVGTGIANTVINQQNLQKQWQREDTAVQRRVADLEAAGLSKNLAAGSAASSTYADTGKLQSSDFEMQSIREGLKTQRAQTAQTEADAAKTAKETEMLDEQLKNWETDRELKQKQMDLLTAQIAGEDYKRTYAQEHKLAYGQGYSGVSMTGHTLADNLIKFGQAMGWIKPSATYGLPAPTLPAFSGSSLGASIDAMKSGANPLETLFLEQAINAMSGDYMRSRYNVSGWYK